jgi:hypothetical protein
VLPLSFCIVSDEFPLLPISKGAAWESASTATPLLFAMAIMLLVAWVFTESRAESPIIGMVR